MDEYESRIKLLYINEQDMVGMVVGLSDNEVVRLPVFTGLPKGFGVTSVNYDATRRGFIIGIWHNSYPVVSPGCRPQVIPSSVEYEIYQVKKNKKQMVKAK